MSSIRMEHLVSSLSLSLSHLHSPLSSTISFPYFSHPRFSLPPSLPSLSRFYLTSLPPSLHSPSLSRFPSSLYLPLLSHGDKGIMNPSHVEEWLTYLVHKQVPISSDRPRRKAVGDVIARETEQNLPQLVAVKHTRP